MKSIDLQSLLWGSEPSGFLIEVAIRTSVMFIFILLALRVSGKRGIKQLSIFELVIIIGMGSAAGDPMFYKDVGIVPAILVFTIIISLYRATTWMTGKSVKFEQMIEGKPLYLVREGKFSIGDFDKEDLSQDEFFAELRIAHVEHLGQVKNAIMETSGTVSLLFYPDKEVRPGLPLHPDLYHRKSNHIGSPGLYACTYCGQTQELKKNASCKNCKRDEWVVALDTYRIG